MRKLFVIFLFALIASNANAQTFCRADFLMQYNSLLGTLNLTDSSYNTDSSAINITHRVWNVKFYNDTNIFVPISTIIDSTVNPAIQVPSNFMGKVRVLYHITTANSCSDYLYDSLYINMIPNVLCQAAFTFNYDSLTNILYLLDTSYNSNWAPITVNTWGWTAQYGGAVYQYNTQNPVIQLNGASNNISVCLTINSENFCQNTFCNVISLNGISLDTCVSSFTFTIDSTGNPPIMYCTDNSHTTSGTINYRFWILYRNGSQYATSYSQNPIFTLQPTGNYQICLTMGSTGGCTDSHCAYFSMGSTGNCQLTANALLTHVSVINGHDGSIDLTVTGGIPPFSYLWNTGDTTQDISNLSSGIYTVAISSSPACPTYTFSYTILQPYDSLNIIVDTLYSNIIDTCFGFTVDSFYVAGINVQGNSVLVEWVLIGGLDTAILDVNYDYSYFGSQIVVLTVNCNGAKDLATYISYIYINQALNVSENDQEDLVKLYPNPVADLLNISFGDKCKKPLDVRIFSNIGQQVYCTTVAAYTDHQQIDVSSFSSGFYFVRFYSENGKPIIRKFVK